MEHGFRVAKTRGRASAHFEGRSYVGLMRHLMLCLVVLAFVAEQTGRLRGEKPGGDGGAGVPGAEPALRGLAGEPRGGRRSWCTSARSSSTTSGVTGPPGDPDSEPNPCSTSAVVLASGAPPDETEYRCVVASGSPDGL